MSVHLRILHLLVIRFEFFGILHSFRNRIILAILFFHCDLGVHMNVLLLVSEIMDLHRTTLHGRMTPVPQLLFISRRLQGGHAPLSLKEQTAT